MSVLFNPPPAPGTFLPPPPSRPPPLFIFDADGMKLREDDTRPTSSLRGAAPPLLSVGSGGAREVGSYLLGRTLLEVSGPVFLKIRPMACVWRLLDTSVAP